MTKKIIASLIAIILLISMVFTKTNTLAATEEETTTEEETASEEKPVLDSLGFEGEPIKLSLQEAIEITLQNNPSIEQAELDLEQAEIDLDKGKGNARELKAFLNNPDRNLTVGEATRKEYGDDYELPDEALDYVEEDTPVRLAPGIGDDIPDDDLTAEHQLNQVRTSNELLWELAQRKYVRTIIEQKRTVEETYFNVLHAKRAVEIYQENYVVSCELYEMMVKKKELGHVSEQKVKETEIELIKAKDAFTKAQNNFIFAKMGLNILLGNNVMRAVELTDELSYNSMYNVDIENAIKESLLNRVDILEVELYYAMALVDFDYAQRKYTKSTNIYKEAEVNLHKAEKALIATQKKVEMDVRQKYLDVLQKQSEMNTAIKSESYMQSLFDNVYFSYDLGMAILTDVQKAQIGLKAEKLTKAQAILDYNLAILEFEESLGYKIEE